MGYTGNEVSMQFKVTRVEAFVDGTKVVATKDRDNRIHFTWERAVGGVTKMQAERRLIVILSKFDTSETVEDVSSLPLFVERDPA